MKKSNLSKVDIDTLIKELSLMSTKIEKAIKSINDAFSKIRLTPQDVKTDRHGWQKKVRNK